MCRNRLVSVTVWLTVVIAGLATLCISLTQQFKLQTIDILVVTVASVWPTNPTWPHPIAVVTGVLLVLLVIACLFAGEHTHVFLHPIDVRTVLYCRRTFLWRQMRIILIACIWPSVLCNGKIATSISPYKAHSNLGSERNAHSCPQNAQSCPHTWPTCTASILSL